ncbi:hypothetical protein HYZ64_00125 [Candidatus Berkelbacteria bacterium]|nr:hypothetical protein [Candidatus Berkelbacteria bacterium]
MLERNPTFVVLGSAAPRWAVYQKFLREAPRPVGVIFETIDDANRFAAATECRVYTSKQRPVARQGIWRACLNRESVVIAATRQGVMLPNLEAIIIDEPDRFGLRNDQQPRYHTLTVARWRSAHQPIALVVGTPALSVYATLLLNGGGRLVGRGPIAPVKPVDPRNTTVASNDLVVLANRSLYGSYPAAFEKPVSQVETLVGHFKRAWLIGFDELAAVPEYNQQEIIYLKLQRLRHLADEVLVPTKSPDHSIFKPNFIDHEIRQRKQYGFPPFGRIAKITEPSGTSYVKQFPMAANPVRVLEQLNLPKGTRVELDPMHVL